MAVLGNVLPAAVEIAAALSVLYLFMIMPRLFHKPDTRKLKEWLYAHRGLHDNASDAPENSLAAFAKAVEAGYGIELDIQLSRDGVPVVFHDFTLDRVCGAEGKVRDHTLEQLKQFRLFDTQERIPRFEEVLRLVDGRVPLIVEFKAEHTDTAICSVADRLLEEYHGMYCMESFHPLILWWYRRHRSGVCRGQLSDGFLREEHEKGAHAWIIYFLLQNLLFNFLTKPDFVAYHSKYPHVLSRRLCRGLYHNTAAAWTIRSQEELKEAEKYFDIFIFEGFLPGRDHGQNTDKI